MNEPVRDWFDYYTDTAAVDSDEIINDYYRNPSGVICFESNTDRSLTLYLRNPQRYVIEFNYEFSNPAMKAFASDYSPVTFVQSSDGNTARMLFTEEFLHAVDMGLCTDDGNIVKDISGDITMMETASRRSFDKYSLVLNADTKPSRIRGAMYKRLIDEDRSYYVLCFNLLNIADTIHQADLHKIYIASSLWTFTDGNYSSVTPSGDVAGELLTSAPSGLEGLADSSTVFSQPEGYTQFYYKTGVCLEDTPGLVSYTIKLVDDAGLESAVTVNTQAEQLSLPAINAEENSSNSPDENTGLFDIVISHPGTTISGTTISGQPKIVYTVKQGSTLIKSGTQTAPVTVSLPTGSGYSVTAYAYYSGYVDSEEISVSSIKVTGANTFFVSSSGSDTSGTGFRSKPFATITRCFTAISNLQSEDNDSDSYTINLLSDITASDWPEGQTSYIDYSSSAYDLTIQGYNGSARTLNLNGGGRAINKSSSKNLTLKNITIKGASISEGNGAGVNVTSGPFTIAGRVVISDNRCGTSKSNVYLAENILVSVSGSLSGRIGISTAGDADIEFGDQKVITSGLGSGNSVAAFFHDGESLIVIKTEDNEAALSISGGSYEDVYSEELSLSASLGSSSQLSYVYGSEKTITIKASLDSEDVTEDTSFTMALYNLNVSLGASYWSNSENVVTLKDNLPPGTYVLYVSAEYGACSYSSNFTIIVTDE